MTTVIDVPIPLPEGVLLAIEAAGYGVAQGGPGKLEVSDADAVQEILAAYEGSPAQLQYHQQQTLAALAELYAGKYTAGFNYNGKNFQIDDASTQKMTAASVTAEVVANFPPPNYGWIATDNTIMPIQTKEDLLTFTTSVGAYVTTLIFHNHATKEIIRSAQTLAELQATDINSGWPEN